MVVLSYRIEVVTGRGHEAYLSKRCNFVSLVTKCPHVLEVSVSSRFDL